jgi:hypothetical protein
MERIGFIQYSTLVLIIVCLIMSFVINDVFTSKLMAALGIVTGALSTHQFSKLNEQ